MKIFYEDNHVIDVDKKPNQPSQLDETGDMDIVSELKKMIKERDNKPGNVYVGLVQRLDRPVGGIMVFAKTSKAASRLSDQIRTRTIDKRYTAVVMGRVEPQTMRDYLRKDRKKNMTSVCHKNDTDAKEATLIVEASQYHVQHDLSQLTIQLITGRSHQIRVQLASRGHGLWGDQRYNPKAVVKQQIALWSTMVSFNHPTTKERLTFTSEPPEEFPYLIRKK